MPLANLQLSKSPSLVSLPVHPHACMHLLLLRRRPRQQFLRLLILRPTNLTLAQLGLLPTLPGTNTRSRSALQALRIVFPQILRLAGRRLVVVVAQREGIVVFFRVGSDGGQGLPLFAVCGAVGGVDFVDGAGLGRFRLWFEEVGVGGFAGAGAWGLGGGWGLVSMRCLCGIGGR